jgi:hydroxymethylglutaryl-CoA reductase
MATSRIVGFYNLPLGQRANEIATAAGLSPEELAIFQTMNLSLDQADHMVENAIGVFGLPLGIGLNFIVNGREVLIPMAIEESSVIAAASFGAKLARAGGGFTVTTTQPEMIGQIQILDVKDLAAASMRLYEHKAELLAEADKVDLFLKKRGGGARDLEVRLIAESPIGPFLVVHLIYNVQDAMGASAVNNACELLAPRMEEITGGRAHLKILSDLADRRLAKATCKVPAMDLAFESVGKKGNSSFTGEEVRDKIIEAWAFAEADPYRAATHNKGIMNGVDAVLIATGNDFRATEAGAHAYAARKGRYTSLSTWGKDADGNLIGELEMPMAVGITGGVSKAHPAIKAVLKLMDVKTSADLAGIIVSVGLAQNLAAQRALATEGIQRGHMYLHARQVAIAAGAVGDMVEKVAVQMVTDRVIRISRAEEILKNKG